MKWISFLLTFAIVFCSEFLRADAPPTFHLQHPLSWMHGLPTGEQPGWSKRNWFNLELGSGNVWNAPLEMHDRRNSNVYEYTADFEQNHLYLEMGGAITRDLGVSLEVPIAQRGGGVMDTMIDEFHLLIGNYRFNRHLYPFDRNQFSIKTNGEEFYTQSDLGNGLGNVKVKFKWWFLKMLGFDEGSCPCGVSLASQTKIPVQSDAYGNTTGGVDQSVLVHAGLPILNSSAIWFTYAHTWLSDFDAMKNWPRYKTAKMFELNLDLAFAEKWGIIMSARAESPYLKRDDLHYQDNATDPQVRADNRVASGWNSLVYWRGYESVGLRYRSLEGNQAQILIVEDWGIGSQDSADGRYTNDAPDVNFVFQMNLNW